jgi:hypothetical protein
MALSLKMFVLWLAAALSGRYHSMKLCTSPHFAQILLILPACHQPLLLACVFITGEPICS